MEAGDPQEISLPRQEMTPQDPLWKGKIQCKVIYYNLPQLIAFAQVLPLGLGPTSTTAGWERICLSLS